MTKDGNRSSGSRRPWMVAALMVLVGMVGLCLWIASGVISTRQQESAVAKIERLGGRVHYDHEVDTDGELLENPDAAEPLGVDDGAKVAGVSLEGARIDDVKFLRALNDLQYLDLDRTTVRDLDGLTGMKKLQVLLLDHTKVQDLQELKNLGELRRLSLRGTQVSDLQPLANLGKLEFLHFQDSDVRNLTPLTGLSRVGMLVLDRTHATDLSPLTGMTELVWLSLDGTKVQDLSPLLGLKNLERIDIKETTISDAQVAKFRAALPDCHVDRVRLSAEELRESIRDVLGE